MDAVSRSSAGNATALPKKILIFENAIVDAASIERELRRDGAAYTFKRAATYGEFGQALTAFDPDLVISNYKLPDFDGLTAVKMARAHSADLSLIVVTGAIDDATGLALTDAGAVDYILKDRMSRLGAAVQYALLERQARREKALAEQALRASEARFRALVEQAPEAIVVYDLEAGHFVGANKKAEQLFGCSRDELVKVGPQYFYPPEQPDQLEISQTFAQHNERAMAGETVVFERRILNARQEEIFCEVRLIRLPSAGAPLIRASFIDITERRRVEHDPWRASILLTSEIESCPDGVLAIEAHTLRAKMNGRFAEMWNIPGGPTADHDPTALFAHVLAQIKDPDFHRAEVLRFRADPDSPIRHEVILTDGRIFDCHSGPMRRDSGAAVGRIYFSRDVTAQRRSEQSLQFANTLLTAEMESSLDGMIVVDAQGVIVSSNKRFCEIWNFPPGPVAGRLDGPLLVAAAQEVQDSDAFLARVRYLYEHVEETGEDELVFKDGRIIERHSTPLRGGDGRYLGRIWFFRDITARKKAEATIRRSEERIRGIVETTGDLIWEIDVDGVFTYVSPRSEDLLGYGAGELLGQSATIAWPERLREAAALAIKKNTAEDAVLGLRETLHLHKNGHEFPVECNTTAIRGPDGKIVGFRGSTRDISQRKRAEQGQQEIMERLTRSLAATVDAIAGTLEKRDPYTAGHQRRVAALAVRIAQSLGFSAAEVEGIRIAGIVHDVGKIQVPAEILNKPGRLSPIEFELLKCHPQAGYEILAGIEFPWPVADMIVQHHERMDGHGYPKGLKGDEILMGARVLAVADVTESMMTHRPYRPGLGLEAALAEIERGKGSQFDPDVVDACIKLFREGHFHFEK